MNSFRVARSSVNKPRRTASARKKSLKKQDITGKSNSRPLSPPAKGYHTTARNNSERKLAGGLVHVGVSRLDSDVQSPVKPKLNSSSKNLDTTNNRSQKSLSS